MSAELVIGATGFIGARLLDHLGPQALSTSRDGRTTTHRLDLLRLDAADLPAADVVYLCAGANGAKRCEGNQDAFRVNVDAPIQLALHVAAQGGFLVWISSMSVEWMDGAYQRQKLAAECVLRGHPRVGIVRAGRVTPQNIDSLCAELKRVGRHRVAGLTRWGTDDIAYSRTPG